MKKLWKRNMVAGAVLLLVCGAIFLNGRYAQQVEETDKILGQATLVDGTEGDAEEVSGEAIYLVSLEYEEGSETMSVWINGDNLFCLREGVGFYSAAGSAEDLLEAIG